MSETYLISETFSTSFLYHIARFANFFFSSSSHPLKNEILTISHCSFIISRLVNFVSRRWTRGMAREFVQIFSVHCFEGPNNIVLFGISIPLEPWLVLVFDFYIYIYYLFLKFNENFRTINSFALLTGRFLWQYFERI